MTFDNALVAGQKVDQLQRLSAKIVDQIFFWLIPIEKFK